MGAPLAVRYWSAALLNGGVDLRHGDLLLDVVDPVVMDRVGLGRSGETEDRSGQPACDDGGKSELLHLWCLLLCLSGSRLVLLCSGVMA